MRRSLETYLIAFCLWTTLAVMPPNACGQPALPVAGAGLWYNAEAITGLAGGAPISSWNDLGSQAKNAVQATSSKQPTYQASVLNGRPVVRFDGVSQNLKTTGNVSLTQANQMFIVFKNNILSPDDTLRRALDVETAAAGSTDALSRQTMVVRTTTGWQYNAGSSVNGSNQTDWGLNEILINGATSHWNRNGNQFLGAPTVNLGTRNLNGRLAIGSRSNETAEFLGADVAEIIAFDQPLNEAENTVLNSHLAAKYGLAVTGTRYSNASGYDRDVFGVGVVDASNQLLAGGIAGLSLSGTGLGAGSWILSGHKTVVPGTVPETIGAGSYERWSRVWYVDNTNVGSGPSINLTFDFAAGGIAFDSLATYKLLYSDQSNLSFGVLPLAGVNGAGTVAFTLDGGGLTDGYYTVARVVPEPKSGLLAIALLSAMTLARATRVRA